MFIVIIIMNSLNIEHKNIFLLLGLQILLNGSISVLKMKNCSNKQSRVGKKYFVTFQELMHVNE